MARRSWEGEDRRENSAQHIGGNGTNVVHTNTLAAARQQPLRQLSLEVLAQVKREWMR
jgi:hypothetical protein